MDAISSLCGTDLYHNSSPNTYWHRYGQLPKLLNLIVHIHRTPNAHRVENHLLRLSFYPSQKYGFLGRVHRDRSAILGTAYFCSNDNCNKLRVNFSLKNVTQKMYLPPCWSSAHFDLKNKIDVKFP